MSRKSGLLGLWNRLRGRAEAGQDRSAVAEPETPTPTKLIVGLGNPGEKYVRTRHNVGFRVVEHLSARAGGAWRQEAPLNAALSLVSLAGESVALLAPQTFMNASGEAVLAALARWPALDPSTDLLVVYDDLDLPIGRIRLRPKGGAGGHNGIGDILERLGSSAENRADAIPRLRFGIGHPGQGSAVIDWVLGNFTATDEAEALPGAIEMAAEATEVFVSEGVTAAMQRFNGVRG